MRTLVFFCLMFFSGILVGQKHDYVWQFGYNFDHDVPEDSLSGASVIDFKESHPKIYYDGYKKMDFIGSGMCMSDQFGNFLFSSNGVWIENHANQSMENDNILNFFEPITTNQPSMALPLGNSSDKYMFLHTTRDFFPDFSGSKDLHFSIIDMKENNGLGKVTELNNIVLSDTLDYGKLTATKHANGEDWWVVLRKSDSNRHFITLFNEQNYEVKVQDIGSKTFRGLGRACFSPDGTKYVNTSALGGQNGRYFDLYNFDRCKGELSNHIQVHAEETGISGGVAFSPNSRFLYIGAYDKIFQYDTWDTDVIGSETIVAEYDNYQDTLVTHNGDRFFISTRFLFMQLAPDGKIYINTPASTRILHTIDSPNEKGLACKVNQHSIKLPTLNVTMMSFPNYRLGALENSPCDTLTTTATNSIKTNQKITLYPNPATGNITLNFETPTTDTGKFLLYDLTGKKLKAFPLSSGESEFSFEINDLVRGLYFYKLEVEGVFVKAGKLVIEN